MVLLVIFALVSIGFSFLCSILEAALLSITPSYIASIKSSDPDLFTRLRSLKDTIDDPLSAILTLNTVAHTAGATGVGAQVAVLFGEAWLGVASAIMTLAILIFSEIIPKTIGAKYWRRLAPRLPAILGFMMKALLPFIWLSQQITRRLGSGDADVDIRGEISALAEIGQDQLALDEDERRIIQNVLQFHRIKVSSIITPRTVCKFVAPDTSVTATIDYVRPLPFSRYPVIDEHGEVTGFVHKSDLIGLSKDAKLKDRIRPIKRVRAKSNIEYVFGDMLRDRQHLAAVYDEVGEWQGIVTLEDILETLLGTEIMDETDNVSNLQRYARQRWSWRLKKMGSG
ncbi:MAG: CNNM domain-containing protein [Marinobacter sp.]|uniref:CNNM domain-containing protein n=1 Tax=Marinobacter sp. TaxID=50741 RepID=UPI0034A0186A